MVGKVDKYGGSAFFFFFNIPTSPSHGAPQFRQFCDACYGLRRRYPTLTVAALRTILVIARADTPITYQDAAEQTGQEYAATAHQIASLADGRGKQAGLGLLQRLPGAHSRARRVHCTAEAMDHVAQFAAEPGGSVERVLNVLAAILTRAPKMSLGTLCVYLYIATHQARFAYDGEPAKIIATDLGISNLPKHLKILEFGTDQAPALLGFHTHDYDQRIRLPYLTKDGLVLHYDLVHALTGRPVAKPRMPQPQALDRLETPEDIDQLADEDFDDIEWD